MAAARKALSKGLGGIYQVSPTGGKTQRLNILLYGDPYSGKTSLSASAQDHPALQGVLFLNVEGGLLSVLNKGISAVDVNSFDHLEEIFWELANGGYPEYQTIVLDSGSEMQALDLEHIVEGASARSGGKHERDEVWLEDYGKSTQRLRRIFRWFRDLDRNVIITSLVKRIYPAGVADGQSRGLTPLAAFPSMTSSLSRSLLGYMDFVWYMYAEPDGTRSILTQPAGSYVAKTRGVAFPARLGTVVKNPDLPSIYNLLLETEFKGGDASIKE